MACLTAAGRLAGAGHVDRANRVSLACNCGAIGYIVYMSFKQFGPDSFVNRDPYLVCYVI